MEMLITLEAFLLEAEGVNVDASPDDASDKDSPNDDYTMGDDATAGDDTGGGGDDGFGPGGDDQSTDYNDMGGGDDAGDSGDGGFGGGDSSGGSGGGFGGGGDSMQAGSELTPEQIKDKDTKVKQTLLLQQMVELYKKVETYSDDILALNRPNVIFSSIQNRASKNFQNLQRLMYNYIMYYFDNMAYSYNFYAYNWFVNACKINLEMIKKIKGKDELDFESNSVKK